MKVYEELRLGRTTQHPTDYTWTQKEYTNTVCSKTFNKPVEIGRVFRSLVNGALLEKKKILILLENLK